jgi:hypothetical protein
MVNDGRDCPDSEQPDPICSGFENIADFFSSAKDIIDISPSTVQLCTPCVHAGLTSRPTMPACVQSCISLRLALTKWPMDIGRYTLQSEILSRSADERGDLRIS